MTNVRVLNNSDLLAKLSLLVAEEKKNIAAQIVLLKEVRRRKLALEMGYPNLMEFCAQELGLTRDQAWKRSQAAGVVEQEPVFLDMLNKGQTTVSSLAVMAAKLTEKTAEQLREFVPGKSKREVEAFCSVLRRDGTIADKKPTVKLNLDLEPEVIEKLHRARKILKANRSELSYEEIIAMAVDLLLDKKDPERKAARAAERKEKTAPRQRSLANKKSPRPSRYIPAKVKHEVIRESDGLCEYRSPTGKRCLERHGLQFDHIQMFSQGGSHVASNLRRLCPTHNRYMSWISS